MVERVAIASRFSKAAVAAVVILCATAAAGWTFGIPALTSFLPGLARMSVPTILGFLLLTVAIFALTLSEDRARFTRISRMAALAIAAAIGLYALADFLASGGLAGSAHSDASGHVFGADYGRVAPATALSLVILATALMLPAGPRAGRLYGALIAAGFTIPALGFAGYAFGVEALYRVMPFSAMALPTTICLVLLFLSALFARPNDGWIAAVLAQDRGGATARRFLPAVIVVPFALAGAMVLAARAGTFDAPFGFAVLAVTTAVGLAAFTVVIAGWLSSRDAEQQRSRQLIEAIVENSQAVMYAKDLAGRYLLINQRYADIFHLDRAAVIGKTDYDIFDRPVADAFRAMDERVAAADRALTEEEEAPQDDGTHTYISVKAPLRDEAGRTYAVFGVSTDITKQRHTEEALLASEERNRLVIESALDAVVTMDAEGTITGWSPQAESIFGWSEAEALGRPVDETIMPERYREAHREGLARYLATGEARVLNRRVELTALRRNGEEFPIELSIAPIRAGDTINFSAFVRDIGDRQRAAERIRTQLERLHLLEQITRAIGQRQDVQSSFQIVVRTLEDRLPAEFVCICRYDRVDHGLQVANVGVRCAALGDLLGMAENAEVPIDQNGLSRAVAGQLVYEPDIAEIDFPFPARLAREGLRSLVVAPLKIEGEVFGVLIAARREPEAFLSGDCEFLRQLGEHVALAAHQAHLRDSLERAYDDLKRTQQAVIEQERLRAIGQMASGIAHDINNAISPVGIYTQSLLEGDLDAPQEVRDYLELVQRVVRDVAATVGRMRDFYRSEGDAELEPLDLNALVPQVVELTRARWSDMPQRRGIVVRVSTDLEADLPPVLGNASELREAMTNLIFNAVDAMPEGGTIAIRTQTLRDGPGGKRPGVRLEVGDRGVGMDEETRERCLDPFFTTKGERGTGLGLAMVQGATQRHQAKLDIDSAPGEGTRVRIDFAAVRAGRRGARPAAHKEGRLLRLLLVDDDPAVLASTATVLKRIGHDVVTADGGQPAIDALRAAHEAGERFDTIITDLGMPYVDGNQVALAAKELFPSMPVVLLTGWGRRMAEGDDAPAHVDFMLPKPLELDELRQVFAQFD